MGEAGKRRMGEKEIEININWDIATESTQRLYLLLGLLEELKAGSVAIRKVKEEIIRRKISFNVEGMKVCNN
jgi:hypothetical protein